MDPTHRARIVAAADLTHQDTVLEIGPGNGSLTALIAAKAGRVIAVELDGRLIPILRERFGLQPHVTVLHGDILTMEIGEAIWSGGSESAMAPFGPKENRLHFKVVANLPYYITGAILHKLLELAHPPDLLVLTVQREVADRMVASPPRMSLLALSVQFHCTAQIVDRIPAAAFRPSPKVESATVRLMRRHEPLFPLLRVDDFFKVARAGFGQKRKQLRNSLASGMGVPPVVATEWLQSAGISPQRRAETLTLEEWGRLCGIVTGQRNGDLAAQEQGYHDPEDSSL